jgi:hypothetical protein
MTQEPIISTSAYQSGRGTDAWKRVYGLSSEDKQALRSGAPVYFRSQYLSGGRHGTCWRRVVAKQTANGMGYYPRVPSDEEIAQISENRLLFNVREELI